MNRGAAALLLCLTTLGMAGRARGQEPRDSAGEPQYTLEGQLLRIAHVGSSSVVELGCEGRSVLRSGTRLLVACGSAGVVQFDLTDPLSPRREGTMHLDGDASGLFLHDGTVWVEVSHVDARPVRIGAATSMPGPALTPASAAGIPRARTDKIAPEDLPSSDHPNADLVKDKSPSIVAPPRQGALWEMSLLTGAFVTMGSLGAGLLGSASVTYRFEAPVVVRAEAAPFGVAGPPGNSVGSIPAPPGVSPQPTNGGRAVTAFAAHMIVGLDTEMVEVGLGLGGASVNQNSTIGTGGQPATSAVSVVEEGRLGARDGLAIIVESSAIAANDKFDLGYLVGVFQIPVSRTMMVIARGGGGRVGFGYGDLGMRVVVRGNGGRGTLALTGFVGGAAIMENLCSANPDSPFNSSCNVATLAGPSLGGGVEWRL
jgi:hypothetical protein